MPENALLRFRCKSNSTAECFLEGPFARQARRPKPKKEVCSCIVTSEFQVVVLVPSAVNSRGRTQEVKGDLFDKHGSEMRSSSTGLLCKYFTGLFPLHREFAARCSAISQVKVDQGLIRYTCVCGKLFEVFDGFLVKSYGDSLFEQTRIRVLSSLRKIVVLPHNDHLFQYCSCNPSSHPTRS